VEGRADPGWLVLANSLSECFRSRHRRRLMSASATKSNLATQWCLQPASKQRLRDATSAGFPYVVSAALSTRLPLTVDSRSLRRPAHGLAIVLALNQLSVIVGVGAGDRLVAHMEGRLSRGTGS
jgi:hypothetical protein